MVTNDTVDGRLVGMPWFTDLGVLYYPARICWRNMRYRYRGTGRVGRRGAVYPDQERKAGQTELWGYVFQGARPTRGLTCNA